ncbi:MAG TPA: hypothetical protein VF174_07310, partial [Micromonosporaceae bacterium]
MADRRDILIRLLGEETVSRIASQAGRGLDKLGDAFEATEHDARGLDEQISEVERSLQALAVAYSRTQDVVDRLELTRAMRKQQTELRRLTSARNLLPDPDPGDVQGWASRLAGRMASGLQRAGAPIAEALGGILGTLPPQAQAAIGAAVVGAVATAGPAVGAAMSAAIVGAAGTGGIIGGIAIAAKHQAVKDAARSTGDAIRDELQRSAVAFVPAVVTSLGKIRTGVQDMGDDLERAFAATARQLPSLTDAGLRGARRAVEGIASAAERSGPVIAALGTIAERTGDLVGDAFESMAENAEAGGRALTLLWGVFELGARSVLGTVEMLTRAFDIADRFAAVLTGNIGRLFEIEAAERAATDSGDGLSQGLQELLA